MLTDHSARPTFPVALPVELYYQVFLFLDIKDILALRQTCKRLHALTQERELWSMMFAHLRATQALPCSRAEFLAMLPGQAERVLATASNVEASFLEPREHDIHHIPPPDVSTSTWRMLAFISDRFVFSVDNAMVMIWDTLMLASSPAVVLSPWAHFTLSNVLGYVHSYSTLHIAISRVDRDQRSAIVYSVALPPSEESKSDHGCLHEEAVFPLSEGDLLKHMDPSASRALLFRAPATFEVLYWHNGCKRINVPLLPANSDELWDGITSLRFCGPYILCFRYRSVEAYPIPTDVPRATPSPALHHQFGPVCFRAVSLSNLRVSRCSSGEVYTIFMLSSDIYHGMFHYRIRVTAAPLPSMSVQLLARGGIRTSEMPPVIPGTEMRYTWGEIFGRMWVSTWSLGSMGLRGVWVDRQRGSIDRRVVAFTTIPARLCTKANASGPSTSGSEGNSASPGNATRADGLDIAPTMEGKVVHVISSYDLRDDVTICAVSEWSGRIAMVSRAGNILII